MKRNVYSYGKHIKLVCKTFNSVYHYLFNIGLFEPLSTKYETHIFRFNQKLAARGIASSE